MDRRDIIEEESMGLSYGRKSKRWFQGFKSVVSQNIVGINEGRRRC